MLRSLFILCVLATTAFGQEPFPAEFTRFKPAPEAPVFRGDPGKWDARIRERGWIMWEDGIFKMWYTGFDDSPKRRLKLGYATSKDGINWTRNSHNPLIDDHWVEDMIVVRDNDRYIMFAEGEQDRMHWFTSPDGIKWTREGRVDIRKTDGQPISDGPFGTPTFFHEDKMWYLLYERADLGIWLAKSTDLKMWKHVQDEPVMKPGPDEYDRDQIAVNQVIKHQGKYYAFFHGSAQSGPKAKLWTTNVAVSDDLIHWKKYAKNPLFPTEKNWSSGILVNDGKRWLMYTMHPEVRRHVPDGE